MLQPAINRDARMAILKGFVARDVSKRDMWALLAEREGYGLHGTVFRRVRDDFSPEIAVDLVNATQDEVAELEGALPLSSPPRVHAIVEAALKRNPEKILPQVLPDELFAALVEAAWSIYEGRYLEEFHETLGSIYEPPDSSWINQALSKNGAPCRFLDGAVEWVDPDLAGEQPVVADLADLPEMRNELRSVREEFRRGDGPDDYNAVGARCDRILRSLARQSFDPAKDLPEGQEQPGPADVKRQLTLFFEARAHGKDQRAVRRVGVPLVEAAYDQAQIVKHRKNTEPSEAGAAISMLCTLIDLVAAVHKE